MANSACAPNRGGPTPHIKCAGTMVTCGRKTARQAGWIFLILQTARSRAATSLIRPTTPVKHVDRARYRSPPGIFSVLLPSLADVGGAVTQRGFQQKKEFPQPQWAQ